MFQYFSRLEDIDLFPGGLSEIPKHGGTLGPTFSQIIGFTFKRLKYGDRFWFENRRDNPYPFTKGEKFILF